MILDSGNGTVTLSLPADASLRFDAWTSNGTVRVEGFTNVNYTRNDGKHRTGIIGTGAAAVTLSSSNGSVTIRVRQPGINGKPGHCPGFPVSRASSGFEDESAAAAMPPRQCFVLSCAATPAG